MAKSDNRIAGDVKPKLSMSFIDSHESHTVFYFGVLLVFQGRIVTDKHETQP